MTSMSQSREARTQSRPLATPKVSVRVGCWNVRINVGTRRKA